MSFYQAKNRNQSYNNQGGNHEYQYSQENHEEYNSVIPYGYHIDAEGRLLKDNAQNVDPERLPEDYNVFISRWQKPQLSARSDWEWSTKIAWPDVDGMVILRRLDVFEKDSPKLQMSTLDIEESRQVRMTPDVFPVRSIFFLNTSSSLTLEVLLESAAPPRRSKYRPKDKQNQRDMARWITVDKLNAFLGPMGVPGSCEFYVDYCDFPDRYFISSSSDPAAGQRRLYRFAAYSATQYYVLEKQVFHQALDAEGGSGYSYTIEAGPLLYTRKDWRVICSFYGFDHQLSGTSQYTIYRREDPFPRMIIALQNIEHPEEWNTDLKFYAFDVPIPGTARYSLQHCLRSIQSIAASIPRHRITTADPRIPWEFRMTLYMFPADLSDCTIVST